MEETITIATLTLTGLLTIERLLKNCAPNFFASCTGLRHADFECAKCLSASLDYANTPASSSLNIAQDLPLARPSQSNEHKDTHAAHETHRLSLDDLRDILENKPIDKPVNEPELNIASKA